MANDPEFDEAVAFVARVTAAVRRQTCSREEYSLAIKLICAFPDGDEWIPFCNQLLS